MQTINSKQFLYIFLFFIFVHLKKIISFKCGSGKLKYKPPYFAKTNKRSLENSEFTPIRIKSDYTYLQTQLIENIELFEKIKESIEETIKAFEEILSVKREEYSADAEDFIFSCYIEKVDPNITNWINEYDVFLFPFMTYENDDYVAAAGSCLHYYSSRKPLAGFIQINNNEMSSKKNDVYYLKTIFIHEITHILVFNQQIFSYLNAVHKLNANESTQYITTPNVLERARIHFACPSLGGVPLEDQGGDGSKDLHWEARYMLGDYMTSVVYAETTISDITLAFFEDSGWYKVNYYTGGLFRFGKNKGCDFFKDKCIYDKKKTKYHNEFCTKSKEPKCLSARLGSGECYIVKENKDNIPEKYRYFSGNKAGLFNANYCPVGHDFLRVKSNENYYFSTNCKIGDSLNLSSQYGEVIGNNSLCFESSLIPYYSPQPYKYRSICYKVKCDKKNKTVIVFIDKKNVTCPTNGGTLSKLKDFRGKIKCPPYNLICTSDIWCNEMFECINKKSVTDNSTFELDLKGRFLINDNCYIFIILFILLFMFS